ncbi:MAG: hypothetical protein DRR08_20260, partial [Candidatus Parabeggiatoa sp. nov. 2]
PLHREMKVKVGQVVGLIGMSFSKRYLKTTFRKPPNSLNLKTQSTYLDADLTEKRTKVAQLKIRKPPSTVRRKFPYHPNANG